jgi:transitional endoplasmic reticulum ATPase
MTGGNKFAFRRAPAAADSAAEAFFHHSEAQRVSTDTVIAQSLRRQYPELKLTILPVRSCNLLSYAAAGFATVAPLEDPGSDPAFASLTWTRYAAPARRLDGGKGVVLEEAKFAKYQYQWKDHDFIVYVAEGREGYGSWPEVFNSYILSSDEQLTNQLILEAGSYHSVLHDQTWVFDQGFWEKSRELWLSVQKASWDNVILDPAMKAAIINDVNSFFDSKETYDKLKVPWKRGIIYHGPPGNGKTISIKAMMHDLYQRDEVIPTLYVRSLSSVSRAW